MISPQGMNSMPAYLVGGIGAIAALLQAVTPVDPSVVDHVERLGIVGLLSVAVIVLWRKLQEKDTVLMSNYKSMADALAANRVLVEKMSDTLDSIKLSVDRLDRVRSAFSIMNKEATYGKE